MKNLGTFSALVLSCLFAVTSWASGNGGDVVNNGGGASELTVVYAYQNYESLTEVCTRTIACNLLPDEENLLQNLIASLPQEQSTALDFQAKAILGEDLFHTGTSVGSLVEINKDLLWKSTGMGTIESYNLANALELLTLAWSQHHPEFNSNIGLSLSKKVANHALVGKVNYLPFLASANLRLLTIQYPLIDELYLDDGYDSFIDLHSKIIHLLPCSATQLSIFTFQWSSKELQEGDMIRILTNGRIGWKCSEDETLLHTGSLSISFKTRPATGTVQDYLDKRTTSLKMTDQLIEMNLSNIN